MNNDMQLPPTLGQWKIDTHEEELLALRYEHERYQDFWEWYENKNGITKNELFDEFEKWEDDNGNNN
jgi:hypothetical protein